MVQNIAVIGAAGFVGRHLVNTLAAQGKQVAGVAFDPLRHLQMRQAARERAKRSFDHRVCVEPLAACLQKVQKCVS